MLHDPERIAEARSWFVKASDDLRAAAFELTAEPPLTADIVFHAQQAVEKAIKGFLTWHDRVFRKTHNLVEIGEIAAAIESSLEPLLRRAAPLTEYAWRFRYPGDLDEPPVEEAREALATALEVFDSLLTRLPAEVRP
jgi:HEPN domain-containing protein